VLNEFNIFTLLYKAGKGRGIAAGMGLSPHAPSIFSLSKYAKLFIKLQQPALQQVIFSVYFSY